MFIGNITRIGEFEINSSILTPEEIEQFVLTINKLIDRR
jgi:hypothetical protein